MAPRRARRLARRCSPAASRRSRRRSSPRAVRRWARWPPMSTPSASARTFARDLSDDELEQTIAYLIQRRDRADLDPADREVAIENLAVFAAEVARRGREQPGARSRRGADVDPRRHHGRAGARRASCSSSPGTGRPPQPSAHRAVPRASGRSPHLGGRCHERRRRLHGARHEHRRAGESRAARHGRHPRTRRPSRSRDPAAVVRVPPVARSRRDAAAVAARVPLPRAGSGAARRAGRVRAGRPLRSRRDRGRGRGRCRAAWRRWPQRSTR